MSGVLCTLFFSKDFNYDVDTSISVIGGGDGMNFDKHRESGQSCTFVQIYHKFIGSWLHQCWPIIFEKREEWVVVICKFSSYMLLMWKNIYFVYRHCQKIDYNGSFFSKLLLWRLLILFLQAYNLSRDHKPELEVERERILKAGGFIHAGRVNGSLNLARAIGT